MKHIVFTFKMNLKLFLFTLVSLTFALECNKSLNEVYNKCSYGSCGVDTCGDLVGPLRMCDMPWSHCWEACVCPKDYIRNNEKDRVCIPKADCANEVCGKNQYMYDTYSNEDESGDIECPPVNPNEPVLKKEIYGYDSLYQCRCNKGYFRAEHGDCVLPENCPGPVVPMCKLEANEVFSECGGCDKTCTTDEITICTKQCIPGCKCKEGYSRHQGSCIENDQCDNINCNGRQNEVFSPCNGVPCGPNSCSSMLQPPFMCIQMYVCQSGCICEKGHLKNKNNECIPIDECADEVCAENETFQMCENDVPEMACVSKIEYSEYLGEVREFEQCKDTMGSCRCAPGFARTSNGICVEYNEENCVMAPPPPEIECNEYKGFEYSDCAGACFSTCRDNLTSPEDEPADEICAIMECKPGCQCKKGHVLTKEGNCIEERTCYDYQTSCQNKPNEIFNQCNNYGCGPDTCKSLIYPILECAMFPGCYSGCACITGHFRDSNGICIEEQACGKEACGINEELLTCPSYNEQQIVEPICPSLGPVLSALKCDMMTHGCYCKKGYFRNYKTDKCVLIDECPVIKPVDLALIECEFQYHKYSKLLNIQCNRNTGTILPVQQETTKNGKVFKFCAKDVNSNLFAIPGTRLISKIFDKRNYNCPVLSSQLKDMNCNKFKICNKKKCEICLAAKLTKTSDYEIVKVKAPEWDNEHKTCRGLDGELFQSAPGTCKECKKFALDQVFKYKKGILGIRKYIKLMSRC